MRLLLGLILMPIMARLIMMALLGLSWLKDPQSFQILLISAIWKDVLVMGVTTFFVYSAPTMIVLLPVVDRLRPLGLGSGAMLAAAGAVATVLLSLPLHPNFDGVDLGGKRIILALVIAAVSGGVAGLIFVACRRGIQRLSRS